MHQCGTAAATTQRRRNHNRRLYIVWLLFLPPVGGEHVKHSYMHSTIRILKCRGCRFVGNLYVESCCAFFSSSSPRRRIIIWGVRTTVTRVSRQSYWNRFHLQNCPAHATSELFAYKMLIYSYCQQRACVHFLLYGVRCTADWIESEHEQPTATGNRIARIEISPGERR